MTILYTIYTWVPVLLLVHLGNGWIGIPIKVCCAIWLISAFNNLFNHPLTLLWIGAAGAGFLLNAVWFAIFNLWPPYWARVLLAFLIFSGFGGINVSIRNRQKFLDEYPGPP